MCPQALDYLRQQGFENAMLIHGGITAWIDAGFGTVGAGSPQEHADESEEKDGGGRIF